MYYIFKVSFILRVLNRVMSKVKSSTWFYWWSHPFAEVRIVQRSNSFIYPYASLIFWVRWSQFYCFHSKRIVQYLQDWYTHHNQGRDQGKLSWQKSNSFQIYFFRIVSKFLSFLVRISFISSFVSSPVILTESSHALTILFIGFSYLRASEGKKYLFKDFKIHSSFFTFDFAFEGIFPIEVGLDFFLWVLELVNKQGFEELIFCDVTFTREVDVSKSNIRSLVHLFHYWLQI